MLETMIIKNGEELKQDLAEKETAFIGMRIQENGKYAVKQALMKEWGYEENEAEQAVENFISKAD